MNKMLKLFGAIVVAFLFLEPLASAWDKGWDSGWEKGWGEGWDEGIKANKRRGRVYFKMVCTVCHIQQVGKPIPPNAYTMDEWRAYIDAGKHDATGKSNPSVPYFTSHEYRKSIMDTNKAAKKFANLSEEQLYADVREFVVSGAKDSDTPASCQ